jgi:hypothetical protein
MGEIQNAPVGPKSGFFRTFPRSNAYEIYVKKN